MRVTIIADDNNVMVDGNGQTVDCSALAAEGNHVVQWYGEFGEIEFVSEIDAERKAWTRKPNEVITDFSPYQTYVDQWAIEKAKEDANAEQQRLLMEEQTKLLAMPSPLDLMLHDHENRIRALEGQPPLTIEEFIAKRQPTLRSFRWHHHRWRARPSGAARSAG